MAEGEITATEAEILGWALDGDSMPLYAIGWPPEAKRPSDPADRQLPDAQQAAIRLLRDGLLEVKKGEAFDGGVRIHEVDPELWEDILSDPRNWGSGDPELDARESGPHFEVGATEAGTQAWLAYAKHNGLIGFRRFDRSARHVTKRPS
jgi:hypothetical protein